jgi:phosphatidylserine/phosphatidylglycerophosphate/cardiolipin synthase-like enzyme
MVLNEWGQKIWAGAKSSLNRLNQWDQQRVYKSNVESYQFLKKNLSIDIYQYFDFVHYKVALVDDIFLIGSANIDQDKNGKIFEAGVVCASDDNITNLNKILSDDISKSTPFTFVGEK